LRWHGFGVSATRRASRAGDGPDNHAFSPASGTKRGVSPHYLHHQKPYTASACDNVTIARKLLFLLGVANAQILQHTNLPFV
jgi:hypothetical protein